MSRLIELGRAVLSSPATDHELWLTTFITISPKRDATYLQQLTSVEYLDALTSGAVWVSRGHGLYIDMTLSLRDQLLPNKQLQDLANAVLNAPVWDQLRLEPTHSADIAMDPGTIRLDVNHSSVTSMTEGKKHHRIFSDVPAVDIQPPKGIASVSLQSIRICMDILEASPRRRPAVKRTTSTPGERKEATLEEEDSDTLLYEIELEDSSPVGHIDRTSSVPRATTYGKRKRPAAEGVVSTQPVSLEQAETSKRRRNRPTNDSSVRRKSRTNPKLPEQIEIASMVDGALRLSISSSLSKAPMGLKAKASTFRLGLADVAPAIWKTGYIVALSQRAHLLPTIACSIGRIGGVKATSISLRDKIKDMKAVALRASPGRLDFTLTDADYEAAEAESAIASHLWVQSQRSLMDKPMAPIKPCVAPIVQQAQPDSDDMLADEEQAWQDTQPTTSFHADGLHECFEGESALTAGPQATQQQGRSLDSPGLLFDIRDDDDLLLDSHSPNAISATACPSDEQLHTPGSPATYPLFTPNMYVQQSGASSSHTLRHSSQQQPNAEQEFLHQLSAESDVDHTEDLLLVS